MKCKTLLGNRNIDFTIDCLNSFVNNCEDGIELVVYEDGSLTAENAERLKAEIKNVSVVTKAERDAKINSILSKYPKCQECRNETNFALKLFDVILNDDEDLFFIDSDVYFLNKFRLPTFERTPIFIFDNQNAYSFSPTGFFSIDYPIATKINTGLFYFPRALYNLDYLEELLSHPQIKKGVFNSTWIEQTLWAFMAARSKEVYYFAPTQIMMAAENLFLTDETLAVHLVSTWRFHYESLTEIKREGSSPVQIELQRNSRILGKVGYFTERAKKSAIRRLGLK